MVTYRKLKDINYDLFKDDLIKSDLCSNPPEDINSLVTEYNQCLRDLLDKHAPLQTRKVKIRPVDPWYNEEIADEKRKWEDLKENCEREKHQ